MEDNKKIDELAQMRMKEIENWKNANANSNISRDDYNKVKKDAEEYKV